ncbi:sigma-70 family RNA polymerase sigma factor [Candidatus Daviesbacteria bacterium]|nr:sigma-70 family RNA polymerase sigma factor [Candidatus Daviesbacteria bacterium]
MIEDNPEMNTFFALQIKDLDLVRRTQSGDLEAFGDLYIRYQRRVTRILTRFGCSDVENVVGDVFLKAFTGIQKFRPETETSFKSWIDRITINTGINAVARKPSEITTVTEFAETHKWADPEATYQIRETILELLNSIGKLPSRQRMAIKARFGEGLDSPSIAKLTNTTIGGAKALVHRALEQLRRNLQPISTTPSEDV